MKPGKYLMIETLTPKGDIRIWEIDFERKEVTVILSVPADIIFKWGCNLYPCLQ